LVRRGEQQAFQVRSLFPEEPERLKKDGDVPAQLGRPAAGKQTDDGGFRDGVFYRRRGNEIEERMAHELHRHARRAVLRLLEGEDDQHLLHEALEHPHAAGAARPDLRADEVERGHAELLGERQHAAVEPVVVHADQRGGGLVAQEIPQAGAQAQEEGDLQRGLPEAGHAARGQVLDELVGDGPAQRPAHRGRARGRVAALQRGDEVRGVKIARRVSGDDEE
jgi:hypothetical protein